MDLNRNFPNHWAYDEEGSSSIASSETYRGTAPVSEPETAAMKGLLDKIGFAFQVNYHSNGQWLLYAEGWQIGTPTADDPIYFAMSGNLDEPAIEDFHPGLSSDVLYVTNGETTDYAHVATGALAWTPELSPGCPTLRLHLPRRRGAGPGGFERNLPFAQSVGQSAVDPDDPVSVVGIETKPFYLNSDDPYKRGLPGTELTFKYSSTATRSRSPVNAKRSLGPVTAGRRQRRPGSSQRRHPSGRAVSATPRPRPLPPDARHRHRHEARRLGPGVVRGEARRASPSPTRPCPRRATASWSSPPRTTPAPRRSSVRGPNYLDYYLNALADNGIEADRLHVDARGRTAPDSLGVLSHYDAAAWYSGDDIVTRTAGRGPGNADRLALDELLEFRAYLNEGGRVAYTSDFAGAQYTGIVGEQLYDPKGEIACDPPPAGVDERRCLLLAGSGDGTNDVLQYWFGGYLGIARVMASTRRVTPSMSSASTTPSRV